MVKRHGHATRQGRDLQRLGRRRLPPLEGHARRIFQQYQRIQRIGFTALHNAREKSFTARGLATMSSMRVSACKAKAASRPYSPVDSMQMRTRSRWRARYRRSS
jgi:hypothetical protein